MRAPVTGVSERIGGAICRQIASQPDSKISTCVRQKREGVEQFADELRRQDCSALILEGDLRYPATPERFVGSAAEQFGELDALVSNAGAVEPPPLKDMRRSTKTSRSLGSVKPSCRCRGLEHFTMSRVPLSS